MLRLAISQMIAERAGQSFSLLVLDEVFGSLDDSRRHNVVDLLRRLHDRWGISESVDLDDESGEDDEAGAGAPREDGASVTAGVAVDDTAEADPCLATSAVSDGDEHRDGNADLVGTGGSPGPTTRPGGTVGSG